MTADRVTLEDIAAAERDVARAGQRTQAAAVEMNLASADLQFAIWHRQHLIDHYHAQAAGPLVEP